jgi:uncharacterized protein
MNRVVHFEIQAEDLERAMAFYRDVFSWAFTKYTEEPPYWGIITADKDSPEPGINGGLLERPADAPPQEFGANAYVCTIVVADFDEIARKIEIAGGYAVMPKFAIPGMAWQGYFVDTEGNTFGIHQPDENAE